MSSVAGVIPQKIVKDAIKDGLADIKTLASDIKTLTSDIKTLKVPIGIVGPILAIIEVPMNTDRDATFTCEIYSEGNKIYPKYIWFTGDYQLYTGLYFVIGNTEYLIAELDGRLSATFDMDIIGEFFVDMIRLKAITSQMTTGLREARIFVMGLIYGSGPSGAVVSVRGATDVKRGILFTI
jgi:hypothetical protein